MHISTDKSECATITTSFAAMARLRRAAAGVVTCSEFMAERAAMHRGEENQVAVT
jgi:hypothetical protein